MVNLEFVDEEINFVLHGNPVIEKLFVDFSNIFEIHILQREQMREQMESQLKKYSWTPTWNYETVRRHFSTLNFVRMRRTPRENKLPGAKSKQTGLNEGGMVRTRANNAAVRKGTE